MIELPIYKAINTPTIPDEIKPLLYSDCKIILTFSGGKDSVAMLLYLLELGIDKNRIELHHHEVDGKDFQLFDWACTPSYCQAFADAFGIPIVFSWRKGGIMREIYRENEGLQDVFYQGKEIIRLPSQKGDTTKRKFPAVTANLMTRWCSSVVKIDVLSRVITNSFKAGDLLILTGERRQESPARSKYKACQKHKNWTKSRNAWHWRPIIDFTEKQVWDLFKKYKVQPHPCYELGWSRCSCQTCIFSSPNTWASIFQLSPQKIDYLAKVEKDINHTIYHKITIWDKVKKGISFIKPDKLKRWKNEALGIFVSPIFVEKWRLPQGAFSGEHSGSL